MIRVVGQGGGGVGRRETGRKRKENTTHTQRRMQIATDVHVGAQK